MFHVFTHAFFKCLLFLSAGLVIHAVHSNDLADMGGLRKGLPVTYISTLIACLAIAGVFPFSGFFSKDEILLTAFQNGHYLTFATGFLTGGLTAFYMFRFFFLIFHGEFHAHGHPHENGYMTFSIAALAVPSLLAGWIAKDFFAVHLTPPFETGDRHFHHPAWLPFAATGMGLLGLAAAYLLYGRGPAVLAGRLRGALGPVYTLVQRKFYIDELYLFITRRIIFAFVAEPARWFDRHVVDGTMNLVGFACRVGGSVVQIFQNGQVQFYLGVMLAGIYLLYRFL
jgi:NADH-quinone oxidoreductase subunit L